MLRSQVGLAVVDERHIDGGGNSSLYCFRCMGATWSCSKLQYIQISTTQF